jgi:hypothetical protein
MARIDTTAIFVNGKTGFASLTHWRHNTIVLFERLRQFCVAAK